MAQAKKSKQEDEPGGAMSPEQFGEQARALNEQIVETASKIGQDALQHYVDWLQAVADEQRTLASSPRGEPDGLVRLDDEGTGRLHRAVRQDGGRHGAVGPAAPELVIRLPAAAGCRVRHR